MAVERPRFTSRPGEYEVVAGGQVVLECGVRGLGPDSTLIWKKDGRMISADNRLIR